MDDTRLEESIQHCKDVICRLENEVESDCNSDKNGCLVEPRYLLKCLEELKELRNKIGEREETIRRLFKGYVAASTDYNLIDQEYQYLVYTGILGKDCPLYPNNDYFNSISCPGCHNYPEYAFCSNNFQCVKGWPQKARF